MYTLIPKSSINFLSKTDHNSSKLVHSRFFYSNKPFKDKGDQFIKYQTEGNNKRKIVAKFKSVDEKDRSNFINTNCLVTLSIGQPIHYGPHLAATLSLINSSFKSCTFVLGDSLQRHTMKIVNPSDESELLELSEKKGDLWLEDNINMLSKLRIPWSVKRWDHWLKHEKFPIILARIKQAYLSEPDYKKAFDDNITQYVFRLKNRGELHIDEKSAHEQCLKYLQEECAAMCLWLEENCQYELYANGRTPAMQATYIRFIETIHSDLLKPISLRFKSLEVDSESIIAISKNISKKESELNLPILPNSILKLN